jgi:hypothetical protein
MMDLFQQNTGGQENLFDGSRMRDGLLRIGVQRFYKGPDAAAGHP